MADISAFSNASFDACAWVNSVLKNKPEEESLESYLASLAMKVHVVAQDYTDQLENGMVDAIAGMPRAVSEVARMEEALRSVDSELLILTNQMASFDDKNAAAVEELSRLDTLKINIEICRGTLEEHARWNQLVREAWLLLENGGRLSDAADRVENMIKSLEVLKNVPGHAERSQECEAVISALFSALEPKIRSDVSAMNLSALKEYIYVYEKLGRSGELEGEYAQLRPQQLRASWTLFKPTDDFAQWLTDYFASLQSFLLEEHKVMCQLFGHAKAPAILAKVLLSVTAPMSNELAIRLEDEVKRNQGRGNEAAILAYREAEKFAAVACKVLATGMNVPVKVIAEALLSIVAGFIQFSEQFVESNNNNLKSILGLLIEETIYFDSSQTDSIFDDVFEDELKPVTKPADLTGKPDGRKLMQSLDADNLDDLVGLLERYADKLLFVADNTFSPLSNAIQNSCDFVKGLRIKSAMKLSISSMRHHFRSILQKVSDLRIATGLNAIDVSDLDALGGSVGSSRTSQHGDGRAAPANIRIGSGGESDSYSGLLLTGNSEIALAVAKHYSLVGQEHTSAAKLFIPSALKCLQAAGRLFSSFIEFEAKTGQQLEAVLDSLFQTMPFAEYVSRLGTSVAASSANSNTVGAMVMSTLLETDLQGFSELKGFLIHAVDAVAKNRELKSSGVGVVSMPFYAELSASSSVIFGSASSTLQQLRFAAGSLLLDLCTMAPEAILKEYSGWDDFSDQEDSTEINYDNLLPQTVVTQVGEHLLSLVNEIETFASSDAIYDLAPLYGTASDLNSIKKCWKSLFTSTDVMENNKNPTDALCRRASCREILIHWQNSVAINGPGSSTEYLKDVLEEDRSLQFVNEWLTAVTDHLGADIGYLVNVTSALGILPHPMLLHFKDIFGDGKTSAVALLHQSNQIVPGASVILRELHKALLQILSNTSESST